MTTSTEKKLEALRRQLAELEAESTDEDELDEGDDDDEGDSGTKKRNRRLRSPHPGVKLKPPAGRVDYWRARYVDPDTGKEVDKRVPPVKKTKKQRREWAILLSRKNAKRKADLDAGGVRKTNTSLENGVKLFYEEGAVALRKKTVQRYTVASNYMLQWAEKEGVACDSFDLPKLMQLRTFIYEQPKRYSAKGKGKKGSKVEAGTRRSNASVNSDLRGVGTILNWLRKKHLLPKLSLENLLDGLEKYTEDKGKPVFLKVHELQKLFEACERHDVETFKLTRKEKTELGQRKGSRPGRTPRFICITPLVIAALLTGMRLDELCLLEWALHVDLDAVDHNNNVIGQIELRAKDTKTHGERVVYFNVSPALRELFVTMYRVTGGKGRVFDPTYDEAEGAMKRLRSLFGAPKRFTWQVLRATCATFLANATGIYGAAADFHAAQQLGHSTEIQRKNYAGRVPGISPDIRTLEGAMKIEEHVQAAIARIGAPLANDNVVKLKRSS